MLLLYPQLRGVQDIVPLIHARSVLLLNSLNLYKAILESKTGLNAIALTSAHMPCSNTDCKFS